MKTPREYVVGGIREFAKKNDVYESAILWAGEEINKNQGSPSLASLTTAGAPQILFKDHGWGVSATPGSKF